MRSRLLIVTMFLLFGSLVLGCAERGCNDDLWIEVSPQDKKLGVGKTFKIKAEARTCGGRKKFDYDWIYESRDPAVVHVDSQSGQVKGLKAGEGKIDVFGVTDQGSKDQLGSIYVTVIE